LVGRRTATGGRWEGLFLEVDASGCWRVLSKTRGKLQPGETVTIEGESPKDALVLTMLVKHNDGAWAARPSSDADWRVLLESVGRVPLPPYIRGGEMTPADRETYQTMFADEPGAVAAPTAGLHFTPELLARLAAAKISAQSLTLHVGLGTFRPVTAATLADHPMHREWCRLSAEAAAGLNAVRDAGGRIVAVGTTSVRVLESAADAQGRLHAWQDTTNLFIRPPYKFRAADALVTNFHLPKSTLLMLVYAFGGPDLMRRAYAEAIEQRYRFYSYGDAMLIV
ncbi:MAG: tRNA preQ1(34) S-adenosylmethionine ribosyltransferase-isomerase QueA, partial [Planctomycetales bacterium]|nr:tRNA preQ1(34) S-adenosylmethionine ribosyltransferase-isomerase QueA [Planctomycetales bacterium]